MAKYIREEPMETHVRFRAEDGREFKIPKSLVTAALVQKYVKEGYTHMSEVWESNEVMKERLIKSMDDLSRFFKGGVKK